MKYWVKESLQEAGWAPILIVLLSFVVGKILKGYTIFPGLDKLFHIAGGMAIAYFFCVSIFHFQKLVGSILPSKRLTLSLALTLCTAIGWELLELVGDMVFNTRMNFGVADTLLDVLFGLLGGLVIILIRADKVDAT